MFNTIGRIVIGIIAVLVIIALAEEFIKKPDMRPIYYFIGGVIILGIILSTCNG